MIDTMLKPVALVWTLAAGAATVGGVAAFTLAAGSTSPVDKGFTGGGGTVSTGSASGSTGNGQGNNGNGNGNTGSGNPGHPIGVTWSIDAPLAPGRAGQLAAKITNQNNQAINLQSVTVTVNSASKAGCDKTWLTVGSSSQSLRIDANSFRVVNIPIQLTDNSRNQDACKGASFNLTVNATAVQA